MNEYKLGVRITTLANKSALWHLGALTALMLLIGWPFFSSLTFFSSDTGLRFLQVRELIDQTWRTFSISYPVRFLDPELGHVPYYYAYSVLDNELFLSITPFFPLISSFFFNWFGPGGLSLLPVFGGILVGLSLYKLARLANLPFAARLLWLSVFSTPVLFYSLTLWDHTIGTGLAMLALYSAAVGITAERPFAFGLAGAAAGLAAGQRAELYVFVIALGSALCLIGWRQWKGILSFGLGFTFMLLPIWGLQYVWTGHPLGMGVAPHLFGFGVPDTYPVPPIIYPKIIEISFFLLYIESRDPLTFSATLLILGSIVFTVFTLRVPSRQKTANLYASMVFALLGYVLLAYRGLFGPFSGILSTFPLIGFSLVYLDQKHQPDHDGGTIYKLVLFTMAIFLGLMIFFWPAFGGRQWGSRYLLPVYPLLLYLAVHVYHAYRLRVDHQIQKALSMLFGGLVIMSLVLQLVGVRTLWLTKQQLVQERTAVTNLPVDLILTNDPFLPSLMTAIRDKQFLYAADTNDVAALVHRLKDANIQQFAIIQNHGQVLDMPESINGTKLREVQPNVYRFIENESD